MRVQIRQVRHRDRRKKEMMKLVPGRAVAVALAVVALGCVAGTAPAAAASLAHHATTNAPNGVGPTGWWGPWGDITACVTGEEHFDGVIYIYCTKDSTGYWFEGAEYTN
jgi:hypothetical protein